jgi:hypothetical protein
MFPIKIIDLVVVDNETIPGFDFAYLKQAGSDAN